MELKASPRTILGKQVKTLRQKGLLPVVLYGEGVPAESLSVAYKDFEKALKQAGESTLVTLDVEGKTHNVLIHDIVKDPLMGTFTHADFYAVRMDRALKAHVPLEFTGESAAVKNEGGILVKVLHEVEVEALPKDLPREFIIDISALNSLESRFIIKDIALPRGVKILADEHEVVALIEKPRSEEELASLSEAPVAPEVGEVKTEQEVKCAEKEASIVEEGAEKE